MNEIEELFQNQIADTTAILAGLLKEIELVIEFSNHTIRVLQSETERLELRNRETLIKIQEVI